MARVNWNIVLTRLFSQTAKQEFRFNKKIGKHISISQNGYVQSRFFSSYKPIRIAYDVFEPRDGADSSLPPLIFGHAGVTTKESWGNIPQIIADKSKRKAYSLDIRDHGDSEWNVTFSYDLVADDFLHFMGMKGISKTVFIGHSLSGVGAIRAAFKHPEMFEMLFIEEAHVRTIPQKLFDSVNEYIEFSRKIVSQIPPDYTQENAVQFIQDSFSNQMPADATGAKKRKPPKEVPFAFRRNGDGRYALAADLDILIPFAARAGSDPDPQGVYEGPAYFIYGTKSPYKINKEEDHIRQHFPKAELIPMQGASHTVHLSYPKEFTEVVLKRLLTH